MFGRKKLTEDEIDAQIMVYEDMAIHRQRYKRAQERLKRTKMDAGIRDTRISKGLDYVKRQAKERLRQSLRGKPVRPMKMKKSRKHRRPQKRRRLGFSLTG